jgi:oligo-1,6-glucosidase
MQKKWWKEGFVYQIYPRSFKDSNHDGIGDLKGIIEKIEYLVFLGVKAIWLNPIYESPNDDMGYDISDYEKIMAEFGTMEDFDQLVQLLHQNGIRLIMDLVVNHSSDEHAWFIESRKSKDNPYRDFYIWKKGKETREPNNWSSFFTPSAWTYDQQTEEWYLHLFSEKQPDLNWENENLRTEVYQMINRWLDRGVDGFRMDVINLISKKEGLPDGIGKPDERYVFSDVHFAMQPKMHDHLKEMRKNCFESRDCMCVGETPFVNPSNAGQLVDDGKELDMIFHFDLMDIDSRNGKWNVIPFDILAFKNLMTTWQQAISWNSLFWSNHDQPRTVSRFGNDTSEDLRKRSAKMLGIAMHLMKGTSFIYQGEEIGMTNASFTSEHDLRDIESIHFLKQAKIGGYDDFAWRGILKKGRDNARTPMQWDDTPNAGFSEGEPWIKVTPNYTVINVKNAIEDEHSILHFYKKLIALKTFSETLTYGDFKPIDLKNAHFFIYIRTYKNEEILVICNMTNEMQRYYMPSRFLNGKILLSSDDHLGDMFSPYAARVIRRFINHPDVDEER